METICWNLLTQLPDVLRVKWEENWIEFWIFFSKLRQFKLKRHWNLFTHVNGSDMWLISMPYKNLISYFDLEFKMMKYSSIIKHIVCYKFQNTEMKRQNKI